MNGLLPLAAVLLLALVSGTVAADTVLRPVSRPVAVAPAPAPSGPAGPAEAMPRPRPPLSAASAPSLSDAEVARSDDALSQHPLPRNPLAAASLVPLPRPSATSALGAIVPAPALAVRPEPRPLPRPASPPASGDGPERLVNAAVVITQPAPSVTTGRKGALCGDPAIQGTAVPGITSRVIGCGMGAGAKISSIDGIQMSPAVTIDCPTALALRAWITDGLRPAVGKRGGGVKTIEVMGGYDCRPVNNKPGNRISEHGRGNAIDIGGFILADGEVIRVLWHWGKGQQGRILQAMHWAACNDFGTVLGPAANAYHRNHFHFDTARRRSSYCR